jgi:hypothetical protein
VAADVVSSLAYIVVVLSFYGLFYRHVVGRLGALAERLLAGSSLTARHSQRDVNDALKLVVAGLSQLLFATGLWLIVGAPVGTASAGLTPAILGIAMMLGLAELGAASTLGRAATMIATRSDAMASRLLTEGQGGWMRQFQAVARVGRGGGALPVVVLYVTGEEIVFRVVTLQVLSGLGEVWAVVASTTLFVGVQIFGMPSARAAVFPMVGSAVVGMTHAWLFLQVPALLPLVLAHSVFLFGALAQTRGSRVPVAA